MSLSWDGLKTQFPNVSSCGNVGRSRSRSRLGLKIKCLGLVSVSCHRMSFTSQYAQLSASLQNCVYIVLNARCLYCLLIHKFTYLLQCKCMRLSDRDVIWVNWTWRRHRLTTGSSLINQAEVTDKVKNLLIQDGRRWFQGQVTAFHDLRLLSTDNTNNITITSLWLVRLQVAWLCSRSIEYITSAPNDRPFSRGNVW